MFYFYNNFFLLKSCWKQVSICHLTVQEHWKVVSDSVDELISKKRLLRCKFSGLTLPAPSAGTPHNFLGHLTQLSMSKCNFPHSLFHVTNI